MHPTKYRKKPIVIEAMQWDGTIAQANEIIDWVTENKGTANFSCAATEGVNHIGCEDSWHTLGIVTMEGKMHAQEKYFIIRGVQGEFYPCDAEVFRKSYDTADGSDPNMQVAKDVKAEMLRQWEGVPVTDDSLVEMKPIMDIVRKAGA